MISAAVILAFVCCLFASPSNGRPIGAAYQINNNRDFNAVIVWSIAADGSLTYVKQVPTGGSGSGPLSAAGTDPLGSQETVTVQGNNLFVVNANSSTITYFTIDRKDATKLNFIASAPTNGQFPVSVTACDDYVCALTGGLDNGIRCWRFGPVEGLVAIPQWDRSLVQFSQILSNPPQSRPALSQISFTPRGDALVVAIRNVAAQGQVLVYAIRGSALAQEPQVILPTGGVATFGFDFIGNSNVLVAADPRRPAGVDVVSFDPTSGTVEYAAFQSYAIATDPLPAAPCWAVYSPLSDTTVVLDASAAAGRVVLVGVNPDNFTVTAVTSVNVQKGSFEAGYIALSPNIEVWYVNTPANGASLSSFTIHRTSRRRGQRQLIVQYVGAYTAPASANIGPQNHGVATFLHRGNGDRYNDRDDQDD